MPLISFYVTIISISIGNITDSNVTVQSSAEPLHIDAQKLCILHNFAPALLGIFMHYMHENTSRSCKAEVLHSNCKFSKFTSNLQYVLCVNLLLAYFILYPSSLQHFSALNCKIFCIQVFLYYSVPS